MSDFKVRCIDDKGQGFDLDETYTVVDGVLKTKTGMTARNLNTLEDVNRTFASKFELVPEPQQFTKDMLKTGMRVETRDGRLQIVIKDFDTEYYGHQDILFVGDGFFSIGSGFSNDLVCEKLNPSNDIVKVYGCPSFHGEILDINKSGKLLWQRPEPKHYTISEAEAKLSEIDGQPVKIGE
jgi:hypothetical protein